MDTPISLQSQQTPNETVTFSNYILCIKVFILLSTVPWSNESMDHLQFSSPEADEWDDYIGQNDVVMLLPTDENVGPA